LGESLRGAPSDDLGDLLEEIEPEFRALVRRFRIPEADADDLVQEALLTFLVKRASVVSPRPWLIAVLRNRCLLYWRRRRRGLIQAVDAALLEELGPGVAPAQQRSDLRHDLGSALAELTPRCRRILRLRYGLDYTGPEIASKLESRVDTIRQATLRCLSALSRCLTAREEAAAPVGEGSG